MKMTVAKPNDQVALLQPATQTEGRHDHRPAGTNVTKHRTCHFLPRLRPPGPMPMCAATGQTGMSSGQMVSNAARRPSRAWVDEQSGEVQLAKSHLLEALRDLAEVNARTAEANERTAEAKGEVINDGVGLPRARVPHDAGQATGNGVRVEVRLIGIARIGIKLDDWRRS